MTRKEYLKNYYLKNKLKYNKQSEEWYENNKERAKFNYRAWRMKNKEHLKKYKRNYYLNH